MKVLLIDDHILIGKSLELSLERSNEISEFRFCSDPTIALDILNEFKPSVVLLDIHIGMATLFLTKFIRCHETFLLLLRLPLKMSLLGSDASRQMLKLK